MPQYELNIRDYWQILRRRRWVFIVSFVAVLISTVLYTKSQKPLYKAMATVRVVQRKTLGALLTDLLSEVLTTPMESYVRVAKSRPVLERVIKELNIVPKEASAKDIDNAVLYLQGIIKTERIAETDLIRIEVIHPNSNMAAEIANKTAESYKIENLLEKNKQAKILREFIEIQLSETKEKLKKSEDRLLEFKEKEGVTGIAIPLTSNLVNLETEKSKLLRTYTEKHPDIIRIDEQINSLKQQMQNLSEKELEFARFSREVGLDEKTYRALKEKFEDAKISEAEKVSDVSIVDLAMLPKRPFKPKVGLNMSLGIVMGFLLSFSAALITEQLDTSLGTIEDIEGALKLPVLSVVPFLGVKKEKRLAIFKNLLFSLAPKPDTVTQLKSQIIINYPSKSSIVESYRILYANLRLEGFSGVLKNKIILVTSAGPEEGKSITTVNLAISIARAGVKTLIIDCDLRRSIIHKLFGFKKEPGLTDILMGSADLKEATKGITDLIVSGTIDTDQLLKVPGMDNLFILTSGTPVVNVVQLLESREIISLFENIRQNYEVVLLDSPPILAVSDSVIIAPKVDGIVLVYRVGKTARNAILRAKVQLEAVKASIRGAVLNNISPDVELYSTYYYPYKYYGEKEKREEKMA